MDKGLSLNEFLAKNHIDRTTWDKANVEWETLQAIAADHDAQSPHLESSAELFAKVIQKFDWVHSVRWRVKDSAHLLEKIVRKRAEGSPKYLDITLDNYFERVTDLVGVRALHLFKSNCFDIDAALKSTWVPIETPVAYIREGDSGVLKARFQEKEFEVRNHPAGYRSVHYVIKSTPLKRTIIAEIQVRTIFEEGWSEIDHTVRYPNFSDNELVEYFLEIFNRMAGSADDMGGFVLGLVATLNDLDEKILVSKNEKEATLREMEQALNQLESVRQQDNASQKSIALLKQEVEKLKKVSHTEVGLGLNAILAHQAAQAANAQKLSDLFKASATISRLGLSKDALDGMARASEQARRGLFTPNVRGLLDLRADGSDQPDGEPNVNGNDHDKDVNS